MKHPLLLVKITKRLQKIARRVIPRRMWLRPEGVIALPTDTPTKLTLQDDVIIHPIYPGYVTTLDISEELYQACSEYWKPQRSVVTDYIVVEVPNGRLHTDNENSIAIISGNNRLIDNVTLSMQEGKVTSPEKNNIFRQRMFSEPVKLQGTVFTLLSGG